MRNLLHGTQLYKTTKYGQRAAVVELREAKSETRCTDAKSGGNPLIGNKALSLVTSFCVNPLGRDAVTRTTREERRTKRASYKDDVKPARIEPAGKKRKRNNHNHTLSSYVLPYGRQIFSSVEWLPEKRA